MSCASSKREDDVLKEPMARLTKGCKISGKTSERKPETSSHAQSLDVQNPPQLFDEGAKECATLIFYSCRCEIVMQRFQTQVICHFQGG